MVCAIFFAAATGLAAPRLKIGDVKQRLARLGVSTAGIVEADELRKLLSQCAPEASSAQGYAVQLERVRAAEGSMGSGVTVYDKVYYSIRLELSSSAETVRWVLDSAASNSLLSPRAADLLGARDTGVTATADTASSTGASGFRQVDLGIASLAGGLESGPLQPVVMQLPVAGECGLLGLDFLSRYDVDLRLRSAAPMAIFHDAGSTAAGVVNASGLSELSCLRLSSGLLSTAVTLSCGALSAQRPDLVRKMRVLNDGYGAPVPAIVDLGSAVTLINWEAAAKAGLNADDPRVRQTEDVIAGPSGAPVRVAEARLTLELGDGARRENVLVNIADLPVFAAVGLPGAAAVLGLDSLAPRAEEASGSRVVLAARDAKVWVEAGA